MCNVKSNWGRGRNDGEISASDWVMGDGVMSNVGVVTDCGLMSMLSSHDPQGPSVQTKTNRQVELKSSYPSRLARNELSRPEVVGNSPTKQKQGVMVQQNGRNMLRPKRGAP
jgi:hypothetical protein